MFLVEMLPEALKKFSYCLPRGLDIRKGKPLEAARTYIINGLSLVGVADHQLWPFIHNAGASCRDDHLTHRVILPARRLFFSGAIHAAAILIPAEISLFSTSLTFSNSVDLSNTYLAPFCRHRLVYWEKL